MAAMEERDYGWGSKFFSNILLGILTTSSAYAIMCIPTVSPMSVPLSR